MSTYSRLLRCTLLPLDRRAPFVYGTVPQEQVDEVLIRHPSLGRHILEVIDRRGIEADGYLAFERLAYGFLRDLEKSYSFLISFSDIFLLPASSRFSHAILPTALW